MNFVKLYRTFVFNLSTSHYQKLTLRIACNDSPSWSNFNASNLSKLIHTNSPFFYKKVFEEKGVDNADIKSEENGQSSNKTLNNLSQINKSQKYAETNQKKKKDSFSKMDDESLLSIVEELEGKRFRRSNKSKHKKSKKMDDESLSPIVAEHEGKKLSLNNKSKQTNTFTSKEMDDESFFSIIAEHDRKGFHRNNKGKRSNTFKSKDNLDNFDSLLETVEEPEESLMKFKSQEIDSHFNVSTGKDSLDDIDSLLEVMNESEDSPRKSQSQEIKSQSNVRITTKKTLKKRSPPSDQAMIDLIQDIIEELDIKPQEGDLVAQDLAVRYEAVKKQDQLVKADDFEKLLQDIRTSSTQQTTQGYQGQDDRNKGAENITLSELRLEDGSGERLGIFDKSDFAKDKDEILNADTTTWSSLDWYQHYKSLNDERINQMMSKYYIWSGYEELMEWTKQGKLWKFPVNNEDVLTEEAEVPFYEHVFLEDKLNEDNWCPKEGPIRNFMLSVTTALSLNPYLTVREKHEHIQWFRDYFTERIETIKNLGLVQ